MLTPRRLKALHEQGKNIAQLLREEQGLKRNTVEIIEIAYDLQAGSYIAAMEDLEKTEYQMNYTYEIANIIDSLLEPMSILEAGVGEATTLSGVLKHLKKDVKSFGFDLSWSRVAYARQWLQSRGFYDVTLCTGSLFHIPFADNSIELVYTSHSIEPNGGNESAILQELFRITKKYLILLEPGYELAETEARQRMDSYGYCKNLKGIAESLGFNVLRHDLFPFSSNPLNPTAITIIKKEEDTMSPSHILACPKFKTPLDEIGNMLFSPEALVVYPIIGGIPCLRIENGVFASKYHEVLSAG
ncbi:protein of unknown function DUF343 [Nitrosococcus halophilus Nc 4]|uniref:Methyltransferase domain-containing protein n=1 Tax=Nitrosococcus halophilus (strain Nc4) TaxID=472759 RepID=D5BVF6_NITHN|nr:methyltransferase domain-containing protein [Nitrosococcus halophilus]ADE13584.1 protein of unknown function DUF343 [Nitrosococcus halophilus Nc 4]